MGGLITGAGIIFYGTASQGGANGAGTAFRLTPSGTETVFYSFAAKGFSPAGGLTGYNGNFYGRTVLTFNNLEYQLYKLSPSGSFTVLADIPDSIPSDLIAWNGNLYGATYAGGSGGCSRGCGSVFELTPNGKMTQLYSFCDHHAPPCSDGWNPSAGLYADNSGNLYGTTNIGGASDSGVIFRLAPDRTYKVLYNFCSLTKCADGSNPAGELIADRSGNLYGTTSAGGAFGKGTVFKLLLPGGKIKVLHSFTGGKDGASPGGQTPQFGSNRLFLDGKGTLFGTTPSGGGTGCFAGQGCGAVWKNAQDGTFTVLHTFTGGADGGNPAGTLAADKDGNLYGTTQQGGKAGCRFGERCGVVFKLSGTGLAQSATAP